MLRRAIVGSVLLVGLCVGLAYQPDVGTAADLHSAGLTDPIVGTNHAKPLPRVTTASDVVRAVETTLILLLVVLATLGVVGALRAARLDDRRSSLLWARVRARRGPPAPAVG